ncbi:hypothetical protein AVEN_252129-1 [Araneus ventricosus]|uniref:Uncharacterized protein n=1 Tax=Araneus ventricosus TaxID=182803 RepID=A0A4Y2J300_ARAVE|nr:hypothetical protein AVEN_252129-1 [Araneus ventricosus]
MPHQLHMAVVHKGQLPTMFLNVVDLTSSRKLTELYAFSRCTAGMNDSVILIFESKNIKRNFSHFSSNNLRDREVSTVTFDSHILNRSGMLIKLLPCKPCHPLATWETYILCKPHNFETGYA